MLKIREASEADFDQIWQIFHTIASAGDTYAYPTEVTRAESRRLWLDTPRKTFVAEDNGEVLYYIKTHQAGPGAHVCNCGYMVVASAQRTGQRYCCRHVQTFAGRRAGTGLRAMQFNFVASTNEGAVRLWKKLGFEIVGRLPGAFKHPGRGNVDALVMYKRLVHDT